MRWGASLTRACAPARPPPQVKLLERRAANLRLNEPAAYRVAAIGYGVRRWALASLNPNPNPNPKPNPNPNPNPTPNPYP